MRINQVIVVPAFSKRVYGRYHGRFCEFDVIDAYVPPLVEHLEHDRIPFILYQDGEIILPNSLIIHCSVGWLKTPSKVKTNFSLISYSHANSKRLAEIAIETVSDWGKCYGDLQHKTKEVANDKENLLLRYKDTMAIAVEPFQLNGPNVDDYLKGGEVFGKMLAQCVYEFLFSRNEMPKLASPYRT